MADSSKQQACHGELYHAAGDVDPGFVVSNQASPAGHPSEGPFDHPAPGHDLEPRLGIGPLNHLDGEVEGGSLVHQRLTIIGIVGKEVLHPRPTLAHHLQDRPGPGGVGNVGGGQVDHQQAAIGVHRDVPLASVDLLARIVATLPRGGRLHRLAVHDPGAGTGVAAGPLTVDHQRHVVDRLEQQTPQEMPEPPIHRLPRWKVLR